VERCSVFARTADGEERTTTRGRRRRRSGEEGGFEVAVARAARSTGFMFRIR